MLRTSNYDLCQYEGSDKTSYLINYNGDMLKIDTAIKAAKDAADAAQAKADTADGKADINEGAISTLNTQINGASGIAADVATVQGSVNTINSLIGNGEPTTTDKTLIGAINELNAKDGDLANLTTTEKGSLVGALNEVNGKVVVVPASGMVTVASTSSANLVTDNTTQTLQDIFDAIVDFVGTISSGLSANQKFRVLGVDFDGFADLVCDDVTLHTTKTSFLMFTANTGTVNWIEYSFLIQKSGARAGKLQIAYADSAVTATLYNLSDTLSTLGITSAKVRYEVVESYGA